MRGGVVMQSLESAVKDAVKKHPFCHASDLDPEAFANLMTDIIKNALQSQDFQDCIAGEIMGAIRQLGLH